MIDFHCHLDLYPDPVNVATAALDRNVGIVSVTTTPSAWPGTADLGSKYANVRTALGLHPQLAEEREHELRQFDRYLIETDFVGEVGLDGSPELRATWDAQLRVFRHILRSTREAGGKVVTVHSRRAASAVLDELEVLPPGRVILHWFSGTVSEARRASEAGHYFSLGPAMLRGAKGRGLLNTIPRDRLLLETDGPFTRISGRPLIPTDIHSCFDALSLLWDIPMTEARLLIRENERRFLSPPNS
ncbi:Qat anti-phage system TatD family nuclease QatD [Curtobacterium sp. MCBA15_016]|uniref:Qat anti-phage system TatD family nuclease QatD n=1 Tax=Curtobacterium sp. MCBA15_016 TaxID=1898740 RepID=UPI0009F372CE